MDDDLRWSPADFRQSMGSDRRILLLGCASLRPDACTSDRTMVIGGAASYVITNDGIHQHPAATCQPCTACNCPQCHISWLDACADFPSLSGQRSHAHVRFTRIKVDLRHLRAGWSSSPLDDGRAFCA